MEKDMEIVENFLGEKKGFIGEEGLERVWKLLKFTMHIYETVKEEKNWQKQ